MKEELRKQIEEIKSDKIVREFYGDDGWTYEKRDKEGKTYTISRKQLIKILYDD